MNESKAQESMKVRNRNAKNHFVPGNGIASTTQSMIVLL